MIQVHWHHKYRYICAKKSHHFDEWLFFVTTWYKTKMLPPFSFTKFKIINANTYVIWMMSMQILKWEKYRSSLLRTIETLALSLFYMTGHLVEKQKVYIEFFDDFTETPLKPATRVDFELQSRFAEVYDARWLLLWDFERS